ncbi:phosphodiesterase [Acutalibacter sp. 1XD8-33]|uniref:phosphodiesterase n=1 Tax=Acutalibacter sp. 1XD8-33 TaxID=2320081 RepID=UPI000EA1B08E|nr:phosphodiesterase [Acutalibacter sp. 1XD8-33]RKJ38883.1 phosphodiesterase [Acutalibacter sp. 1XD8-33]
MKWLIASDVHGSAVCCRALREALDRENAQALLLLGDLLYHGPRNSLPAGYDPKETAALLNAIPQKIFCLRGNCEAEVDQMLLGFPIMAEYGLLESAGHMIFATHGHRYNLQTPPSLSPGDLLLHGHTHVPAKIQAPDGWWYLNPGSVSIPKEDSPRSYMTLENGLFRWVSLDGKEYDRMSIG